MNRLKWAAVLAGLAVASSACASSKGSVAASQPPAASSGSSASGSATAGGDLTQFQTILDKYTTPVTYNGPTAAAKAPTAKRVGILSCSFALEGCRLPTEGVQAAAKKLGWTSNLVVVDDPSKYNGGMKTLLVDKPDVIIATGIDTSFVGDAIRAAKAQHVLLISLIENNPVDPANGYDSDVTPDAKAVGQAIGAKMVIDANGQLKLLNMNNQEFGFAKAITASMLDTVGQCSACKVVQDIKFTASEIGTSVPKSVVTALQSNPDINTVYLPFDPIVGAVVPAMLNAQLTNKRVYSQLGTSDALNYMRQGKLLSADMATPEAWIGWAGVDQAIRLMDKLPLAAENLPIKVLTKDTLPPAGTSFTGDSADYQGKYLALWGISG